MLQHVYLPVDCPVLVGLSGLKVHEAAGSEIKYVELGNEMYDSSRADVMAAYPNGRSVRVRPPVRAIDCQSMSRSVSL